MNLNIDLETYSPTPIGLGVYKYAEESEILIMAYSIDNGPIHGVNVYRDGIPSDILELILDESVSYFESRNGSDWKNNLPSHLQEKLESSIVGLKIRSVGKAKFKFSQNLS